MSYIPHIIRKRAIADDALPNSSTVYEHPDKIRDLVRYYEECAARKYALHDLDSAKVYERLAREEALKLATVIN